MPCELHELYQYHWLVSRNTRYPEKYHKMSTSSPTFTWVIDPHNVEPNSTLLSGRRGGVVLLVVSQRD